jgi:polyisoprenoid-binding protein YceI
MRQVFANLLQLGILLAVMTMLLPASGQSEEGSAPPGEINFTASNLFGTARGQFGSWRITRAEIDDADPGGSVVVVEIDIASIDTGIGRRDNHLRSDDFFDVEKFPTATVELRDFQFTDPTHVSAAVKLRIRGVEKSFPLTFEIVDREARKVSATTTIDRTDFGVGGPRRVWNPMSVKQEVEVRVEAIVPPPAKTGVGRRVCSEG